MSSRPIASTQGFDFIVPAFDGEGYEGSQEPMTITFSGTSARTSRGVSGVRIEYNPNVEPSTTLVELVSTQPCFFAFGDENVEATTADCYLPANFPRCYGIIPGQYIAAIQSGSGGVLYIKQGK